VPDLHDLCDDLAAEHESLDLLLDPLDEDGWRLPTPAAGWTMRDQVAHLYFGDKRARLTVVDPDAFRALRDEEKADAAVFARAMVGPELGADGRAAFEAWREERAGMLAAYRVADPKQRVEWYGPPMSPASKVTARIMETWAHGQDVADALGAMRAPTDRLRHVAHIGVGARRFSYVAHGLEVDETPVYVELVSPSGAIWTWGDASATDTVRGRALDFCLIVTQRRHRDDTDLDVRGVAANRWIDIAQAFAGPPGQGRSPGQFRRIAGTATP
jgi:uncharacterized protein (TIGR03084 family)